MDDMGSKNSIESQSKIRMREMLKSLNSIENNLMINQGFQCIHSCFLIYKFLKMGSVTPEKILLIIEEQVKFNDRGIEQPQLECLMKEVASLIDYLCDTKQIQKISMRFKNDKDIMYFCTYHRYPKHIVKENAPTLYLNNSESCKLNLFMQLYRNLMYISRGQKCEAKHIGICSYKEHLD